MKTIHAISALAVFASLFIAASSAEAQDALLRLKYTQGDVLTYKSVNLTTQEQMGMEITQEQTQYMEQTVTLVEGDIATITVKFTRVVIKSSNPMSGEMSFDSETDKAEDNPQMGFYAFMVGKSFTMKISTRGVVSEVKGFTQIGEEMLKKIEEMSGDNPMMGQISGMLKKMLNDEFMKKTMSQSMTAFPEAPVKTGFSWNENSNVTIPLLGDLVTEIKNTVSEVTPEAVKVSFEGKMETKKEEEGGEEPGEEEDPMAAMLKMMKITGGKVAGTLEFDLVKGQVLKRTSKNTMTIELMGNEMPMVQEQIMELVKKGAVEDQPSKK